ncbi:MAG: GntR family transcriptional regulator [Gemmatimonadetes bacterium]|uniref:GntR family transcriptional regulator n=1 Tax=Candidatus Kutchimonas denitrificans TaxID=3056748 RepID=A0AAE4Z9I2_9BACT|nr:GntR family transcriptional regulator [Gemmatimonadota bacterium]NIR74646.1 GntR family transcriptional regulator [Candidatus Kutchimonas denitrificans]NIS02836.1 GntR family transcriptional regulator [Gemmatimonadota bacterium]NIT68997.1 GntR family transcriptional regulator [Gemmatimonadota bacterium]NIU52302.1 GntR family transcriptional regulator [Gemmatimonadota bacterium]
MFSQIDPRSPIPLYEQIATRIRVAVAAAELRPGDALPSVRGLAKRLRVNPATVVQAYRELEGDGFVEMRQGAGTFVREIGPALRTRARADQARRLVRAVLEEAAVLGLNGQEIMGALQSELGEKV